MTSDRRAFLRMIGAAAAATAFPESIKRALAIPAHHATGTINDVEHVVVLMQENRSFDHYFGTLRGVRGFGDPHPINLASGKDVFHQPDGNDTLLPFHPPASNLGLRFLVDLPHGWTDQHAAWNSGKYDGWVAAKGTTTMAHMTRDDIPYHYALADAFTICDAYHCSLLGPTDPNRYYMWTGWCGNDGNGGGPVVDNAEAGYDWTTYPELLQTAGVTWKVYQDIGEGLDAAHFWGWTGDAPYIGNYGDNSLLYFHQYQNAADGSPLANGARTGTNVAVSGTFFDVIKQDVMNNTLPQVSWIVAPESYCEHGNWPANYGAWYVSQMLDALTANPDVWSKTVLFVMYDENDGLFDHIVPPTAPTSDADGGSTVDTTFEIFPGSESYATGPYGMGFRVPMIVVSPWSKGGFVCSQLFDHTSLIQFLERRFGVMEPNITPWRRALAGDLSACFNFKNPNAAPAPLPDTTPYIPPDDQRHADYVPKPPAHQKLPAQEPGLRFARPLPYEFQVTGTPDPADTAFGIAFDNTGDGGAWFQVRSGNSDDGPWGYTVEGGKSLSASWDLSGSNGLYDLSVYGPNGFFRGFKGSVAGQGATNLQVTCVYHAEPILALTVTNEGASAVTISVHDVYTNETVTQLVRPKHSLKHSWSRRITFGWYDLSIQVKGDPTFLYRLAGHIENGKDSASDPQLGGIGKSSQARR